VNVGLSKLPFQLQDAPLLLRLPLTVNL
jgi:hypothetical protein